MLCSSKVLVPFELQMAEPSRFVVECKKYRSVCKRSQSATDSVALIGLLNLHGKAWKSQPSLKPISSRGCQYICIDMSDSKSTLKRELHVAAVIEEIPTDETLSKKSRNFFIKTVLQSSLLDRQLRCL